LNASIIRFTGARVGTSAGPRDYLRLRSELKSIQSAIGEAKLGGWLLYDLHARNDVTASLVGMGDMSRRFFVLIPAEGEPVAIIHGIEQAPWDAWPWQKRVYVGWHELGATLAEVLGGVGTVAMEFSENSAVPAVDLVPAGIVELVRSVGVSVVSSGDLITRFYAVWSAAQLASHRKASAVLAQVAHAAFQHIAQAVDAGTGVTEVEARHWVLADLAARGFGTGADTIVATGLSAADPHYAPQGDGAPFRRGDVILLDLWAKQSDEMVYADQTWMACLDSSVPARAAELFGVIRDARDAAVEFLQERWQAGEQVRGGEVDDVARRVVRDAGLAQYFIHRTGHSIDRSTHGMGPNIDNYETRETRRIIAGVGFSIEPGIYIPGEIGLRTEINVYVGDDGPEVTTPGPQHTMTTLLH
jgi:Xaa-Pro dipeptidase